MAFHQLHEILRAIAAQRRLGEVRVGGQVAVGRGVEVGEIAAPAAGNQDLAARLAVVIQQQHAPPALPGGRRAEQARRARAQHDGVIVGAHPPTRSSASASATLIPSTAAERMPPA